MIEILGTGLVCLLVGALYGVHCGYLLGREECKKELREKVSLWSTGVKTANSIRP